MRTDDNTICMTLRRLCLRTHFLFNWIFSTIEHDFSKKYLILHWFFGSIEFNHWMCIPGNHIKNRKYETKSISIIYAVGCRICRLPNYSESLRDQNPWFFWHNNHHSRNFDFSNLLYLLLIHQHLLLASLQMHRTSDIVLIFLHHLLLLW